MEPVVILEPWHPWPLLFPGVTFAIGLVLVFVSTMQARRVMRDLGIILVGASALTAFGLLGFLSGTWDQGQRTQALLELGYERPTFSGGEGIVGGSPGAIDFSAVRDGDQVTGQLRPLGDSRWAVVEIDEPEDSTLGLGTGGPPVAW